MNQKRETDSDAGSRQNASPDSLQEGAREDGAFSADRQRSGGASASIWLRQVWILSRKEFVLFFRDPVLVLFLVYGFSLSVYTSSTVSKQLYDAPVSVIDRDRSPASRELIHRFRPPYFQVNEELSADWQAIQRLDKGRSLVVLDIPEGFQQSLREGRQAEVQMLVDASDAHLAYLSSSYGQRIVRRFAQDMAPAPPGRRSGLVNLRPRYWFNPNREEAPFRSLEQLAKMILLFSVLLPASAMAREKERGTVEQLLVSPLRPSQIMLSKVVPMTCIIVACTAASVWIVVFGILGVPLRGNVLLFLALSALFSVSASGIGLLIAAISGNLAQVGLLSILVMPPMILFSGTITPPESMPPFLLPLMYALPMYHTYSASSFHRASSEGTSTVCIRVLAAIRRCAKRWQTDRLRMGRQEER